MLVLIIGKDMIMQCQSNMTIRELFSQLQNIDNILLDALHCRYEDNEILAEDTEQGEIIIDFDSCLIFITKNGHKHMMGDGTKEDETKAVEFLLGHLNKMVPKDFPYNLITEDDVHLWSPK